MLEDEYFISTRLTPNVDCYSRIIYQATGLPVAMFPVMLAIPPTVGWLAQWQEMVTDPEQKVTRLRQISVRHPRRRLANLSTGPDSKCTGVKKTSHYLQRLVSSPLHDTNSPA